MSIEVAKVRKVFGELNTPVLKGIDLKIPDGQFLSISGRSGSGKSTLLYILSTLDYPSTGEVTIDGLDPSRTAVEKLHYFRNKKVGFIFQFHYLLNELTSLENVLLGPRNLRLEKEKRDYALHLLNKFDVYSERDKYPHQMSGGQQQRVAIARALIMEPKYIFADEPTGNLDSYNGLKVMEILKGLNKNKGTTIILVTHESDYARMADREILLSDGQIISDQSLS